MELKTDKKMSYAIDLRFHPQGVSCQSKEETPRMAQAINITLADHLRPRSLSPSLGYDLAVIIVGSLLITACAKISIPLGSSPVPITGQTFAILLVGALLGPKRGALAVLAYIAQGLAGLPVSATGLVGLPWIAGPTGGYLVGFVVAAFITGMFARRGWDRNPFLTALAMTIATAAIFACGLAWLSRFPLPDTLLRSGLLPFLPGAVIKIALATILLPSGWKILRSFSVPPTSQGHPKG